MPQRRQERSWKTYGFEFLSIFVAVVLAFALNHWNENRRDRLAEVSILKEIANGLHKDQDDIKLNVRGHRSGIRACALWRKLIKNEPFSQDSFAYYYHYLLRDFLSIQNRSGYETLQSRGLELIRDDSLRFAIISLYEYDFSIIEQLEADYDEMQFFRNYREAFQKLIAPYVIFDTTGIPVAVKTPIDLSETDRNLLLQYLWSIEKNREFTLRMYADIEDKISAVTRHIQRTIE